MADTLAMKRRISALERQVGIMQQREALTTAALLKLMHIIRTGTEMRELEALEIETAGAHGMIEGE